MSDNDDKLNSIDFNPRPKDKYKYQLPRIRHDKKLVQPKLSVFELWCQACESGDVELMEQYRRQLNK